MPSRRELPASAVPLETARGNPSVLLGAPAAPVDVLVGHILGAWGVRGEVKVVGQSDESAALLQARRWRLQFDGPGSASGRLPERTVEVKARRHGSALIARVEGVVDRDAAAALAGARVWVDRNDFPRTAVDEYYWVDLIGCRVLNRQGEDLGQVLGLIDTGVHSVLRLGANESHDAERLVPFVAAYVDEVDLVGRTIRVDWGLDY